MTSTQSLSIPNYEKMLYGVINGSEMKNKFKEILFHAKHGIYSPERLFDYFTQTQVSWMIGF